jgi:hypothetical protein
MRSALLSRARQLVPWAIGGALLLAAGGSRALVRQTPIQGPLTLAQFRPGNTDCYDRRSRPPMAVVDTHLHVRPFGVRRSPFRI